MASEFDELEQKVIADIRRTYSEEVADHFLRPRNTGEIPGADGYGMVTGPCGDTMEIYLRVRSDRVINATFCTDGCGATIVCGSITTEMVKGKSIAAALRITQDDILNSLGGLPEENLHCALLAADTLREAVKDYLACKNEPWKRAYRSR